MILTLAGSETTATLLSGATYLLLTNPDVMQKLIDEVRSRFKSSDEINLTSVGSLTYMLAVLNESLRCYPPVTSGLVRTVPGNGLDIAGHFVPPGVSELLIHCDSRGIVVNSTPTDLRRSAAVVS